MGKWLFEIIENMDKSICDNNSFKQIIENQNEGVIIVSDRDEIEYVNNKFLKEFQDVILDIYNQEADISRINNYG